MLVCSVHRPPATVSPVLGTTEGGSNGVGGTNGVGVIRRGCHPARGPHEAEGGEALLGLVARAS